MKVNILAEAAEKTSLTNSIMMSPNYCNLEPRSTRVTLDSEICLQRPYTIPA